MKTFIVFALLAAVTLAAPPAYSADEKHAETRVYENNIDVHAYNLKLETSNGIQKSEQGQLVNAGTNDEAFTVSGSYSYIGPDSQTYKVTYVADATGYHPQGAHLPH